MLLNFGCFVYCILHNSYLAFRLILRCLFCALDGNLLDVVSVVCLHESSGVLIFVMFYMWGCMNFCILASVKTLLGWYLYLLSFSPLKNVLHSQLLKLLKNNNKRTLKNWPQYAKIHFGELAWYTLNITVSFNIFSVICFLIFTCHFFQCVSIHSCLILFHTLILIPFSF